MIRVAGLLAILLVMMEAPPSRAETLYAPANRVTGTGTAGKYYGEVSFTVSGTASGLDGELSDAFYRPGFDPNRDVGYYLLSFNTTTSISSPTRDVANFVVGGVPAYSSDNTYTVVLDTGIPAGSAAKLYFGFTDGSYGDNTGGYTITIAELAVPEPGSLALLAGALGLMVLRRRRG